MSLRRLGWLVLTATATLICISCGEVYRPVVIPTNTKPPNPSNFHAVFGINANAPSTPGTALQIDVAGDTNIGEANMGVNPTHATVLPTNARVFVASAGSLSPGQADVVSSFTPAVDSSSVTGLGTSTTFTLPFGSLPVFVTTTQTNAVYVANYGTNSVSSLNTASNVVTATSPVGSHPVAMVETGNAQHLYVLNQGDSTVSDVSPTDLSSIATLPVGMTPVWAVARPDSQRVYVLTQGDGKVYTINTGNDVVDQGVSVGAGANYMQYDKSRNRLYVTSPSTGFVYVFDATVDPPVQLAAIDMTSSACGGACTPVSVTALPDGSRFYVASYQTSTICPDPTVGASIPCMIPMLTVFDARSFALKVPPAMLPGTQSIPLLSTVQFDSGQYAVPQVASCAPPATYQPGTTRFRMFTTAATDSSHVYVSICDAGTIADVITTTSNIVLGNNNPESLITDISAPAAACSGASCGLIATITGFQVSGNIVTFQAANNFTSGEKIVISGLTTGTYLNGKTLTVLGAGLSATQFECNFTNADVPLTTDSGSAVPLPSPQSPVFLLTGQ